MWSLVRVFAPAGAAARPDQLRDSGTLSLTPVIGAHARLDAGRSIDRIDSGNVCKDSPRPVVQRLAKHDVVEG